MILATIGGLAKINSAGYEQMPKQALYAGNLGMDGYKYGAFFCDLLARKAGAGMMVTTTTLLGITGMKRICNGFLGNYDNAGLLSQLRIFLMILFCLVNRILRHVLGRLLLKCISNVNIEFVCQ